MVNLRLDPLWSVVAAVLGEEFAAGAGARGGTCIVPTRAPGRRRRDGRRGSTHASHQVSSAAVGCRRRGSAAAAALDNWRGRRRECVAAGSGLGGSGGGPGRVPR